MPAHTPHTTPDDERRQNPQPNLENPAARHSTDENLARSNIDSSVDLHADSNALEREIAEFARSFGSGVLATMSLQSEALATYAPVIHSGAKFYIYISEIAEHFASIRANPANIELLFLEDECKARSVIVRKRLRYRVEARFIERESAEFAQVYGDFLAQNDNDPAIQMIKTMLDFHLIELVVRSGRYVKGFGQAYAISESGEIAHIHGGHGGRNHIMHNTTNSMSRSMENPHKA